MQPEITLTQLAMAIQLLYKSEQETRQLLDVALDQNRLLLERIQQQHALQVLQLQTISRLEAELQACRSAQQSAFGLVHTN